MRQLLEWNTLDESAKWLSEATHEEWTARRLLDEASRYLPSDDAGAPEAQSILSAALPPGHTVRRELRNIPPTRGIIEEMVRSGRIAETALGEQTVLLQTTSAGIIPLFQHQVRQILASGWTELAEFYWRGPRTFDDEMMYIDRVEPPAYVGLADLVISADHLREFFDELSGGASGDVLPVHDAAKGPPSPHEWVTRARAMAIKIIDRDKKLKRYPDQRSIAEEIAKRLDAHGIAGPRGIALSAETIRRHALWGIVAKPSPPKP